MEQQMPVAVFDVDQLKLLAWTIHEMTHSRHAPCFSSEFCDGAQSFGQLLQADSVAANQ